MHKVFISHHHQNDQGYKENLSRFGEQHNIFIDRSVDTGDISDDLSDERIREKIRDEYLKDSSVTILLAGTDTWRRKHIDWEIYSSMYDGRVNKKSGIIVVNLPSVNCKHFTAAYGDEEKQLIHPECKSWTSVNSREEYARRYPHLPDRIIDNLIHSMALVSVVPWDKINTSTLKFLINSAFDGRRRCDYDLSRPMRRRNS